MRIRELRLETGKTQKELAEYLNISCSAYSDYEREKTMLPVSLLCRLADLYGVSTDYILELTDVREPHPSEKRKGSLV